MNYSMKIKLLSKITQYKLPTIATIAIMIVITIVSLGLKHVFYNNSSWFDLSWLQPAFNHGISYSIAINMWLVILVSLICLLWITRMYMRGSINSIIFILIMSGWLSNFIDRVMYGWVRDWIYLGDKIPFFNFVFNIADVLLILGWILLIYHYNQVDIVEHQTDINDKLV